MLRRLTMFAGFATTLGLSKTMPQHAITANTSITSITYPVCNVLALSGGGSFGATQMGVLNGLYDTQRVPDSFDIITGVSAGGLNAGFLSYFNNVGDAFIPIQDIYANLSTSDVYTLDMFGIFSEYSIYSTEPLESTLANVIASYTRADNGPITLIGSTNLNHRTLDVFRYDTATDAEQLDILMATSAIPLLFPPRHINDELYADGGLISNELIQQALSQKSCEFYNFTFISASSKGADNITIDGFFSYVGAVAKLLFNTFDNALAQYESVKCQDTPRGSILACFPSNPALDSYSVLDFDFGTILYALGKSQYNCSSYMFC